MGFRDPFQYRTCSDIDSSYPDLRTPKWNLKKIKKVKTTNLKLISNVNAAPQIQHLRIDTIWLAQFYFQRYFTQNSFQENTALVFMAACLHLACKANDTPRSLEKLIKGTFKLRFAREQIEASKIDDVMVFVEFKEKVLLAERALLYSFAFDFRTGDPYSFALKYNSTLKLMSAEDGEQALSWLNKAGIVTTLCLQYPSPTLAVVALWFAQHLTHGKVPVDKHGLEWWEKLSAEKQDRVALPPITAEVIEDIHWQLVVELDEKSLENALRGNGKLPGASCGCKACSVHKRKQEAVADTAQAPASSEAQQAEGFPASTPTQNGPGLSSALLEADKDTGASAPRTGAANGPSTASNGPSTAANGPSTAANGPSTAANGLSTAAKAASAAQSAAPSISGQPGVVERKLGTASGAPAHIDQPASAYPVRPNGNAQPPDSSASTTAENAAGVQSTMPHASASDVPSQLQNGHHEPLHGAQTKAGVQVQPSADIPASGLIHDQTAAATNHDRHTNEPGSAHRQQQQQPQHGDPADVHHVGHQQADADDADSLEEGEIEDGEVLPDGTIAGAADNAENHDSAQSVHDQSNAASTSHAGSGYAIPNGVYHPATSASNAPSSSAVHESDRKRKRSPSSDLDHDIVEAAGHKAHPLPQQLPV